MFGIFIKHVMHVLILFVSFPKKNLLRTSQYFGMKTVRFENQEYTFSDEIIYFTQIFPVGPQIKSNSP